MHLFLTQAPVSGTELCGVHIFFVFCFLPVIRTLERAPCLLYTGETRTTHAAFVLPRPRFNFRPPFMYSRITPPPLSLAPSRDCGAFRVPPLPVVSVSPCPLLSLPLRALVAHSYLQDAVGAGLSELVDIAVAQGAVGTVLSTDSEDGAVFGFVTALPVRHLSREHQCVQVCMGAGGA